MAREDERHGLIPHLVVGEAGTILLCGDEHAQHVAGVAERAMLIDDAVDNLVDASEGCERALARRRRNAQHLRPEHEVATHALEKSGEGLADLLRVSSEVGAEQRASDDGQGEC